MILLSLAPEASASANFATTAKQRYYSTKCYYMQGGAGDRNRTGTVVSNRRILSPLRLPVPPPRQTELERVMGIEPT